MRTTKAPIPGLLMSIIHHVLNATEVDLSGATRAITFARLLTASFASVISEFTKAAAAPSITLALTIVSALVHSKRLV